MSYTVATLKDELVGVLHGTTLNQVTNLDNLLNRAARKLVSDIDPIETVRIQQLASPLFDRIYDYACPVDLKDDRIVDIRPQIKRSTADRFTQFYNEDFDMNKAFITRGGIHTVQNNNGNKTLRLATSLTAPMLVDGANSLTDNGTWVVGGSATNLRLDTLQYIYAGGSIEFDVSTAPPMATAWIEKTMPTKVDLTRDLNEGSEFVNVFFTDASHIVSVNYRWGTDNANYWNGTVTSTQSGTDMANGWNLLQFPWLSATKVGSPDVTKIGYVRVTITFDGTALSNVRVNSLTSQLGSIYEIEYYSKCLFRDASSAVWQEEVGADTDIINLDTSSYEIYFDIVALFCAQQIQATDGAFDIKYYETHYAQDLKRYTDKIKSQVKKPQMFYYKMKNTHITRVRPSSN